MLEQLRPFLIGKDPLAGEALWDQMYRSNRHSRDGSLPDGDQRGRQHALGSARPLFQAPVYRLLGGPTRATVEVYGSCLGYSLEPDKVRERCLRSSRRRAIRYRSGSWGTVRAMDPEGLQKNVELVRMLRETWATTDLMFDAYSGWDLNYALAWAKQVEQYRPRWIEEAAHPEKIESFAHLAQEHLGSRWRRASISTDAGKWSDYLQAGAVSVVQADPEWCGGISELVQDLHRGVAARCAGDSARPQHSRGAARDREPVADDVSAGRVSDSEDVRRITTSKR